MHILGGKPSLVFTGFFFLFFCFFVRVTLNCTKPQTAISPQQWPSSYPALAHHSSTDSVPLAASVTSLHSPGPGFLQFSFDICQCSEIYFKHQLTLSGLPGGIFADKIGRLAHHPWMSGGDQSQGHWLTQGSVLRSVSNNNRPWEGIQSESGLMILIQAATTDKAPMLSTVSRCPHCYSLLITSTQIKLILLNQFNVHVILIMLFASNLSLLPQRVWSSQCKVIALQFIAEGTLWNADLIKTNAPTLFSLLGSEPLEKANAVLQSPRHPANCNIHIHYGWITSSNKKQGML